MAHGRWIRVAWATSWRCEFLPRLVAGLAVTLMNESVCLGRLKRAAGKLCDQYEFLCIHPANVLKCIYICYNCPEMCIMLYKSSGESFTNIRKSVKEFISVLVDCAACFSRPHNVFGRVRNVEANPFCSRWDIRSIWVIGNRTPLVRREDSEVM